MVLSAQELQDRAERKRLEVMQREREREQEREQERERAREGGKERMKLVVTAPYLNHYH